MSIAPSRPTTAAGRSDGGLFTRQASGLVRELGVPAAVGISLASVAVVNTFINFNAGLTDFSKSEMYLPLLAAAFIWLVAMFAYRHLLEAIPRAGGEYVYLSRIVSPVAGSMAGIGIAVVFTYVLAANAHFAATFTPVHAHRAGLGLQLELDRQRRQRRGHQPRHRARSAAASWSSSPWPRCSRSSASPRSSSG